MPIGSGSDKKLVPPQLGEDWWAVILGLALIALLDLGVLKQVPW